MTDPKNSAERICDLLFFRGLLEILKIMIKKYCSYLKAENYEEIVNLIEIFDQNIKIPEKLFSLKLNDKIEEEARNTIIQKVEKFVGDYIKGKINVFIQHLEPIKGE